MKKYLFIFGTRPEAIKLAPLIRFCRSRPEHYQVKVCVTAQHREMLDDVLEFFKIGTDFDLNLMRANQTLFDITIHALSGLQEVLKSYHPDNIVVQGDTTTSFVGALAGFYMKIKISHIEAGLRSGDKFSPYPEEVNRILTGHLTDYHFAPTNLARDNLYREGIRNNVWVVGNTVIDALMDGLNIIDNRRDESFDRHFDFLDPRRKTILITCHRRESFGKPIENIFAAIRHLAESFDDLQFVYPVHLNPNVQEPAGRILGQCDNIHLVRPFSYAQLIWIMSRSHFILTDSGGIQEEAPSLGKPVLVMRDVTERREGIEAGTARLVGTDREVIVREAVRLIEDHGAYQRMAQAVNPYGDGKACERIATIWQEQP